MANINDFKLVTQKSDKYFRLLSNSLSSTPSVDKDVDKQRFGFYLYMLEHICDVKDILDLAELVTDTDFNKRIFNDNFDDCGIDAVQINEDERSINLFNFKYAERFKADGKQSINKAIISIKFIHALLAENTEGLKGKIKSSADSIIEKISSGSAIWKFNLYVVSNESDVITYDDNLKNLEEAYGLDITTVGLEKISEIMSIKPAPVDAGFVVSQDAIMSFSENTMLSAKSYIFRLSVRELIRITSGDETLRREYTDDLSKITSASLDYSVLFDNVRGLVLKSKFNENIRDTLENNPSRFFMYNNGLTMTASDISVEAGSLKKTYSVSIKDLKVLNGGQTLRTIHLFNNQEDHNVEEFLVKSEVLVRVFKITEDSDLNNKIAEYTNSQNTISNMDLKSLRSEQIHLEQYLDEHNIVYSRKTGDVGLSDEKDYLHKISMEKFGQILYSLKGFPEKASNQKKQIFDKEYAEVFGEKNLKIEDSPEQIENYFNIKNAYEATDNTYESNDQKIFYILYMQARLTHTVSELIDSLEITITEYDPNPEAPLTTARKLIRVDFRDFLDKHMGMS